jgi:putative hydrolase of the HAD superfamily
VTAPLAAVEAVLFDAGGVLVVPDPIATGPVLSRFGGATAVAPLVRAHYAGMRALDLVAEAHGGSPLETHDWDVYRHAYATSAGVPAEHLEEAVAALLTVWSPLLWRFPLAEAVAALWRLHRLGVPVGVVSNASGQIEGTLAVQGVCQVGRGAGVPVACVVDSHVVGVAKPDPRIFAPALLALGSPEPGRVAYVGDSVANDVGAAAAGGLVPVHLDPFDDHPEAGHLRTRSLHDLPGLLGRA